jgi:sugar phosphate isomerase/epimerase
VTGPRLGIFARIFRRGSAEEVAAAVAAAGFDLVQLNLNSFGLATIPDVDTVDFPGIRSAFDRHGVAIWGLSATYNMIDPDPAKRTASTHAAAALIARAPELGASAVTLCTGTRDPDDIWRAHPGNDDPSAWADMRVTLDRLLPAAAAAGVRLGIEPEIANVVNDAPAARRLLAELGDEAAHVGIVLDPANLLTPATIHRQRDILTAAVDLLGEYVICLHAKDVVDSGYAAAGSGDLDYALVFRLARELPHPVPTIIQDATEDDAPRVAAFLREHANR